MMESEVSQSHQLTQQSAMSASDLTVLTLALNTVEDFVAPDLVDDVRQIGSLVEHARQIWLAEMERQHAAQGVELGSDSVDRSSKQQDAIALLHHMEAQLRQFSLRYGGFGFAAVNCPHPADKFVVGDSVSDLRRARPLVTELLRKLETVKTAA